MGNRRGAVRWSVVIAVGVFAWLMFGLTGVASAQPGGDADRQAQELVDRYAPVVRLKAQQAECDPNGERYAPTPVDIVLDNPQVLLRQVGTGSPVISRGPTSADIFDLGAGFYLDYPGNALDPGCLYEKDFRRYADDGPAVAYAHIVGQDDEPGRLAIQYWFFFYYNDYNNKHEGDWESIQLLFDVGTIDEALATEPVSVGYAQHVGGERAEWGDAKLERVDGTHPVVYTALGSHASYFTADLYLGRSGSEGFGCDSTQGPFATLETDVVVLPDSVADPEDPLAWLMFEGHWGERQSGPFDGPTGPIVKSRWSTPIDWHDDLRSASVVIPGGESSSTPLVNTFCGVVAWGSAQLITAQENPLRLASTVALAAAVAFLVFRRTEWDRVLPTPIARRRRLGEILRAGSRLYRDKPGLFAEVGAIYLPFTVGFALLASLVERVSAVDSLGAIASIALVLVGILVGLGQSAAYIAVTASVAAVIAGPEHGEQRRGLDGYRRMWQCSQTLFATYARILVIVVGLALTIVGLPWAIRQLVRYQMATPVVMLEGLGPKAALARSTELVAGRWFHTGFVSALLAGLVSVVNAAVGLILLVILAGFPLWLFSGFVSIAAALIAPFSGICAVLLYGDAKAEHEQLAPAEPVGVESVGV